MKVAFPLANRRIRDVAAILASFLTAIALCQGSWEGSLETPFMLDVALGDPLNVLLVYAIAAGIYFARTGRR